MINETHQTISPIDKLVQDILKLKSEDDYFEYLYLKKELDVKRSEIEKIQQRIKELLNEA